MPDDVADSYSHMTATYSPEDNKLRLSSLTRLDKETYTRVRGKRVLSGHRNRKFS